MLEVEVTPFVLDYIRENNIDGEVKQLLENSETASTIEEICDTFYSMVYQEIFPVLHPFLNSRQLLEFAQNNFEVFLKQVTRYYAMSKIAMMDISIEEAALATCIIIQDNITTFIKEYVN
jgi:hypothetical protein